MAFNYPLPQQFTLIHKVGNCVYKLLPDSELPKKLKLKKLKFHKAGSKLTLAQKNAKTRSAPGNHIRYLQWLYPDDKKLQKIPFSGSDVVTKTEKDLGTGKPRYLHFKWGSYSNKGKTHRSPYRWLYKHHYTIEIPNWDFNPNILEEIHD